MKKNLSLLFVLSALALVGCSNPSSPSSPGAGEVTVTDGLGNLITANPAELQRIVCVGAGSLRLFSYVGDMNKLVGAEDVDRPEARAESTMPFQGVSRPYYDANTNRLSNLATAGIGGPQHQAPELRKLIDCEPDLIVSYYDNDANQAMAEATGAKVFTVKYGPKTVFDPDMHTNVKNLAKLLGNEQKGIDLVNYIEECKAEISAKTASVESTPKVYAAGIGNWGQTDYLNTHSTYPMFQVAHIKNVLDDVTLAKQGQQAINKETWETIAPNIDIMILDAAGISKTLQAYADDSTIFDTVKAVNDGEVYLQMPFNAYYTNMEIALMNAYFDAASVYPACFTDFNLEAKYNDILSHFLNGATYTYAQVQAMGSSFGGYQKIENLKTWLDGKLSA